MAYRSKVVTVGTSPTALGLPAGTVLVQNLSAVIIYLGGPGVTADTTATGGVQLPASNTQLIPVPVGVNPTVTPDADDQLYARVATGTANLAVLLAV